jgi:hypothetical protein
LRRHIETAPFIGTYPVHADIEDHFPVRRHSGTIATNTGFFKSDFASTRRFTGRRDKVIYFAKSRVWRTGMPTDRLDS